jgi:hypothetical protein
MWKSILFLTSWREKSQLTMTTAIIIIIIIMRLWRASPSGSVLGPVAGYCEHDIKLSGGKICYFLVKKSPGFQGTRKIFSSPKSSDRLWDPRSLWNWYLLTYSRSWALLEEPLIVQPLKNFPAFHGTQRFNTVFTRALHWYRSWAISIQFTPSHPYLSKIHFNIVRPPTSIKLVSIFFL